MVKRAIVKDVDGEKRARLVPETEAERREMARRQDAQAGGVDERDELEDDDDWADE